MKRDPDGDGGGDGGNSGGGSGGSGIRAGLAHALPSSDLVAVGIILAQPSPKYQAGSGGRMVNVSVETWMTGLYRCNQWWIALPNVEDVSDVNRGRVMIKAIPLSAPTGAYSLVDVARGSQGRMRMEGMKLALFGSGGSDGWDMLAGTPPAWFADIWDHSESRVHLVPDVIFILPLFGARTPAISRSNVVLPAPFLPMMPSVSPE